MRLSNRIKSLRSDNKLTQEEFAKNMLVSKQTVSKWENGTCYPSIDSLKYMSEVFNISFDDLISNEELLDIVKIENYNNLSKHNGLLFSILDMIRIIFIFLPLYSYRKFGYIYFDSLFDNNEFGYIIKIVLIGLFVMFLILGIIEIILNNRKSNNVLNKISLLFDIVSLFIILFINQTYLAALMFFIFVVKVVVLLNINKRIIKKDICVR